MSGKDAQGLAEDLAVLDAQRRAEDQRRNNGVAAAVREADDALDVALVAIKQRNNALAQLRKDLAATSIMALDHRLALNAGTKVIAQLARELAACKGTEAEQELKRASEMRSRAYDEKRAEAIAAGEIAADVDLNPKKYPWYVPKSEA